MGQEFEGKGLKNIEGLFTFIEIKLKNKRPIAHLASIEVCTLVFSKI